MNTRFWLALSATGLLAGGAGYGAGYFRGVGAGAEISGGMHEAEKVRQAFVQAGHALGDLSDSQTLSDHDRAQLLMALDVLGGIAMSGQPHADCRPADREILQAVSAHLRAHPLPADRPDAAILRAALDYCG